MTKARHKRCLTPWLPVYASCDFLQRTSYQPEFEPHVHPWIFFHQPSRTLIVTDLIENFETGRIRSRFYRKLISAALQTRMATRPIDMQLLSLAQASQSCG